MIKDLTELAALAAIGGTLVLAACGTEDPPEETDVTDTDASCPTGGCPTGGCPTGGCPTGGCPTGGCPTSGFDADYANSTDFFTQMTGPMTATGTSPHPTSWIYYTEDLRAGIEGTAAFTAPVGAASIKALYTNGAISGYAVMTKQAAGYDTANSDWFYELRDAAGVVTQSGTQANCVGCHAAATTTDYLLGTEL